MGEFMIKYPNQMKKMPTKLENQKRNLKKANLGTDFETKLNNSNNYYLNANIASIYKKPTPIQVVKVYYPARNKARIVEAYYRTPSTTDYNGIYKVYHIDFEAKCCHSKSFSFAHIFKHQIEHLITIEKMGGIAFLLIEFPLYNEVFLLPANILYKKYLLSLNGGKKSISYLDFKNEGFLVKEGLLPEINYLAVVDLLILKNKNSTN